jgi:hypothetical protein
MEIGQKPDNRLENDNPGRESFRVCLRGRHGVHCFSQVHGPCSASSFWTSGLLGRFFGERKWLDTNLWGIRMGLLAHHVLDGALNHAAYYWQDVWVDNL